MNEGSYCADCGTGTKNPKLRETGAGAVEVCASCHRDYNREDVSTVADSEARYSAKPKSPKNRAYDSSRRPGA